MIHRIIHSKAHLNMSPHFHFLGKARQTINVCELLQTTLREREIFLHRIGRLKKVVPYLKKCIQLHPTLDKLL